MIQGPAGGRSIPSQGGGFIPEWGAATSEISLRGRTLFLR